MSDNNKILLHSCEIPMRWGDMDAYGHLNNCLYIRYLEEARVQLLHKMGAGMDGDGHDPVIINVGCTFLKQVVYPATLRVDSYIGEPGNSSFMTWYEIFDQQQNKVGEGYAKVVWMDHATGRSVPLPDQIRTHFDAPAVSTKQETETLV